MQVSRLKASNDFQRVRREGRSWSHPLVVLTAAPNGKNETRIGITAGQTVGSAVARNRAKRRLRAAVQRVDAPAARGWDVVLIARPPLLDAEWLEVMRAVKELLSRAQLLHVTQ